MPDMPWFRVYSEAGADPKFAMAALETGLDLNTVKGIWLTMMCIAAGSPVRGSLYVTLQKRYSNVALSTQLHLTETETGAITQSFIGLDILEVDENGGLRFKNWEKRQFSSDSSAARVRKHRERKNVTDDVTLQKRFPSVSVSESESESDSDSDSSGEDESWLPLSRAFTEATNIPELTGGPQRFYKALEEMEKAGVEPCDVAAAVASMREKGLVIASMASVVNPSIIEMSKRKKPGRNGAGGAAPSAPDPAERQRRREEMARALTEETGIEVRA